MKARWRTRLAAIIVVAMGAALLGLAVNAIVNPPCRSAVYLCPKPGCTNLPPCPGTTDMVWAAEWGVPGGSLLLAGLLLYRRARVR